MAINEPYKMEILESIKEDPITIYHIGTSQFYWFFFFSHYCFVLLKAAILWFHIVKISRVSYTVYSSLSVVYV